MAALAPLPEAYRMLREMFNAVDENIVRKVYEDYKDHANPFDAAVSELLTIAAVQEANKPKNKAQVDQSASRADAPNLEAFNQVINVFPDLTRSVIGGALFQNQGQAQGAIELLLDVGQDKDALAQIRDMNPEKKAQYANDRAKEREAALAERAAQMEREREEMARQAAEERRMHELDAKKQVEAEEQARKARKELVDLLEAKLAAEVAMAKVKAQAREVEAQLEVARRANEAEKAAANAALAKLEEQKERDAHLAREAQEELNRRHRAVLERQPNQDMDCDLSQSIANLKGAAAKRAIENVRAQEETNRANARLAEFEQRERQQKEQIDQLMREKELLRSCTVAAEYSQKEKKLQVSWRLGPDRSPTSYDWIGVFSAGIINPKQYHTYISTSSLQASAHECALPTEPGLYICHFFYGKSGEMIASSEQIYLGPSLDMFATADPVRGVISMKYRVKTGNPTKKDWIGFYRSDKPHKTYIEYKWLEPDVLEGIWEVKMPRRGGYDYEFRFFSHTVRVPMQQSNKVSLPKGDFLTTKRIDVLDGLETKDIVTWTIVSVDPSSWDWIELIDADTKARITWNYLDLSSQQMTFVVPRTPGRYQYRYWAKSIGSGPTALSPDFEVVNRDKVTISLADGVIHVTPDIHSIVTNTSCWVGLFPEGSDKYSVFKYISSPPQTLTFSPPPGRYDARFFSSTDKYNPIARSDVISFNL